MCTLVDIFSLQCLVSCRGCLLVRQSFFHNDPKNFADVGGGVLGCRGFHSSFRGTQSGLSLNIGKLVRLLGLSQIHALFGFKC